ncbi:hypothetical protein V6N13_113275 [Hibiscus sabdariffa]|uniref:Uncharacterized protein n=1 Tax=Hibiscus sabdariffa TaxID=183260 RepID=A0ABR2CU66_9ROSI
MNYHKKPSASGYDFRPCGASSYSQSHMAKSNMDFKFKKGKKTTVSGSFSSCSRSTWSLDDPEFKRKKRVAAYKMYGAETKVKVSLGRTFRWLKDKYTQVVYGSWW